MILIFAVAEAMRKGEIYALMPPDVVFISDLNEIEIRIQDSKNHTSRAYRVINSKTFAYVDVIKKYNSLASRVKNRKAFFMTFGKGKCDSNRLGVNTIGNAFKAIATFLGLPNPENYTGHCGRITGATLMANSGASVMQLKVLGGWQSAQVAEGYVAGTFHNRVTKRSLS